MVAALSMDQTRNLDARMDRNGSDRDIDETLMTSLSPWACHAERHCTGAASVKHAANKKELGRFNGIGSAAEKYSFLRRKVWAGGKACQASRAPF